MWLAFFLGLLHMISKLARSSCVGSETLPYKVGPNEVSDTICNDLRKSASHICTILIKNLNCD